MENEEDLVNILIDDVPYITYKKFIEEWILEGSDELKYLSPYKSIPTWLIIHCTWGNYRDYYLDEQFPYVMKDIDILVKECVITEIRIRKRIFLFYYADMYMGGDWEFMDIHSERWHIQKFDLESNKFKKKQKNRLIRENIFCKRYSNQINSLIYNYFTLPSKNEITEIIYLVTIISIIDHNTKDNRSAILHGINCMFPELKISDWLCQESFVLI